MFQGGILLHETGSSICFFYGANLITNLSGIFYIPYLKHISMIIMNDNSMFVPIKIIPDEKNELCHCDITIYDDLYN